MNIEPIQESIITQLASVFSLVNLPFIAQRLPDADGDYKRAIIGVQAYVINAGSSSPGVRNTNPVTQDRILRFTVECLSRILYGQSGLLAGRHLVEMALVGYRPLSCDRIYFVKDDLDRGEDGIWTYVINFECKTILLQNELADPPIIPSLKSIVAKFINGESYLDDGNGQQITIISSL